MNEHVKTKPGSHSSHWGAFSGAWIDGKLVITPHPGDPDPNPIIQNFPEALNHKARIAKPMVRRGWLEHGPGAKSALKHPAKIGIIKSTGRASFKTLDVIGIVSLSGIGLFLD